MASAEEQAAAATVAQALVLAQKRQAQFVACDEHVGSSWQGFSSDAMPPGTGGQERLAGRSGLSRSCRQPLHGPRDRSGQPQPALLNADFQDVLLPGGAGSKPRPASSGSRA